MGVYVFSPLANNWVIGGDVRDDSAEILFQSLLEAVVSGSGTGRDAEVATGLCFCLFGNMNTVLKRRLCNRVDTISCGLWTQPRDFVPTPAHTAHRMNEIIKWFSPLPILIQNRSSGSKTNKQNQSITEH